MEEESVGMYHHARHVLRLLRAYELSLKTHVSPVLGAGSAGRTVLSRTVFDRGARSWNRVNGPLTKRHVALPGRYQDFDRVSQVQVVTGSYISA